MSSTSASLAFCLPPLRCIVIHCWSSARSSVRRARTSEGERSRIETRLDVNPPPPTSVQRSTNGAGQGLGERRLVRRDLGIARGRTERHPHVGNERREVCLGDRAEHLAEAAQVPRRALLVVAVALVEERGEERVLRPRDLAVDPELGRSPAGREHARLPRLHRDDRGIGAGMNAIEGRDLVVDDAVDRLAEECEPRVAGLVVVAAGQRAVVLAPDRARCLRCTRGRRTSCRRGGLATSRAKLWRASAVVANLSPYAVSPTCSQYVAAGAVEGEHAIAEPDHVADAAGLVVEKERALVDHRCPAMNVAMPFHGMPVPPVPVN